MKKKQKQPNPTRRILGVILALAMVVSLMPVAAFADAGGTAKAEYAQTAVAEENVTVPDEEVSEQAQNVQPEKAQEENAPAVNAPEDGAQAKPSQTESGPAQTEIQKTQPAAANPAQTDKEAEAADTPTADIAAPEGAVVDETPAPAEDEAKDGEDGIARIAATGRTLKLDITQDGHKLETVPQVRLNWAFPMGSTFALQSEVRSGMDKVWNNVSEIDLTDESDYYGEVGFDIYDGGISHVTGTINISRTGETVLTATLPSSKSWVKDLDFEDWNKSYTPEVSGGTYTYKVPYKYGGGFDATFSFGSSDFGSASSNLNFMAIKDDRWKLDSDYNVQSTRSNYYTNGSNEMTWYSSGEWVLVPNNSLSGTEYKMRVFGTTPNSGTGQKRSAATDAQGYVPSQEFTIKVDRYPTLDNVKLAANASASRYLKYTLKQCEGSSLKENGKTGFDPNVDTYKVVFEDGLPASKFYFELFCAMSLGDVKGTVAETTRELMDDNDGGVKYGTPIVAELGKFEQQGAYYVAPVTVKSTAGGVENVYTFYLYEQKDVQVTLELPEGIDAYEVTGDDGTVISPDSTGDNTAVYTLKSGDNYQWKTTADGFYSAYSSFTPGMEEEQTVTAYAPVTGEDYMQGLVFADANYEDCEYDSTPYVNPAEHSYTTKIDSNETAGFVMARFDAEKYEAYLEYTAPMNVFINKGEFISLKLSNGAFLNRSGNILGTGGGEIDVKVVFKTRQADENGVFYSQNYNFHVIRVMSLKSLTAKAKGASVPLKQTDSGKSLFLGNVYDYTAEVAKGTKSVDFTFNPGAIIEDDAGKITVEAALDGKNIETFTYDQAAYESQTSKTVTVNLDSEKQQQILTFTVKHENEKNIPQTYTVVINSLSYFDLTVNTNPEDASFMLTDNASGKRIMPNEDGTYNVGDGAAYTYTVSKSGYITAHDDSYQPKEDKPTLDVTLEAAPASQRAEIGQKDDWNSFRGDNNNGVVDYPLPTSSDDAVLSWATKVGDGYQGGAVSSPIIVGGDMYVFVGTKIARLDRNTGKELASGQMEGSSSFSLVPPIYADGMIIVGLDDMVQAFDAKTLESLWVYHDARGGQMNSSITYSNGYIYLGFWKSEDGAANFVCLSITDEDPTSPNEEKYASWTYSQIGGFYWTGAAVQGDYVVVTTDDGERGYAGNGAVLCLNTKTGTIVDTWTLNGMGDARTSISSDGQNYYFATKGGYFCKFNLSADGKFENKDSLELSNGGNGIPMCTSTPVIANGRAYVGVSGLGQFVGYSGHNITVIDLDSFSIAYSVKTQGYPQVSGLLTTAYTAEDGYNYVYFVDNMQPGKIRVIRDKEGMTGLDGYSVDEDGNLVAYNLFTPSGAQAQYAISSLIADSDGNIYFKNDSGYLMCLSPMIEEIETKGTLKKAEYCVDEVFNPEGLQFIAHYVNGKTKDITKYMDYSKEPLRTEDEVITFNYDLGENQKLYHDENGAPGTVISVDTVDVDIKVNSTHQWDGGKVTLQPTETTEGEKLFTCTVCGATKTESVPVVKEPENKPGTGGESGNNPGTGSDPNTNTGSENGSGSGTNANTGSGNSSGSGTNANTGSSNRIGSAVPAVRTGTAADGNAEQADVSADQTDTDMQTAGLGQGQGTENVELGDEETPRAYSDLGNTENSVAQAGNHLLPILIVVVVLAAGFCFFLIAKRRKENEADS